MLQNRKEHRANNSARGESVKLVYFVEIGELVVAQFTIPVNTWQVCVCVCVCEMEGKKGVSVKVNWQRDKPISTSVMRSARGICSKDCNTAPWRGYDLSLFPLYQL